MNVYDPAELDAWAEQLVADWAPPSPEEADLLRRTYGRVRHHKPAAHAQPEAA